MVIQVYSSKGGSSMEDIVSVIFCMTNQIQLFETQCKHSDRKIRVLEEALQKAYDSSQPDWAVIREIELDRAKAHQLEEEYWKVRSRIDWLKGGDRNTKFFHEKVKHRRHSNRISQLRDEQGSWVMEEAEMMRLIESHFATLFTSSPDHQTTEILNTVQRRLSEEDAQGLIEMPSAEDIRDAVFSIHPTKSPGPDGFSAAFYQEFWNHVREPVTQIVCNFFQSNTLDPSLNQTTITLIPKTHHPQSIHDLRPISLCNVSYKIISKILVSRLRKIMYLLISETQGAFIADDAILFGRTTVQEAYVLQHIISQYCIASGQLINHVKSRIVFGSSVPGQTRKQICAILQIKEAANFGNYLGALIDFGGSKKSLTTSIEEAIQGRLNGWAEKFLSQAGKSLLINTVALAAPIHLMSCFKVNKTFCKRIHVYLSRFWWHNDRHGNGKNWCSWHTMARGKERGGLGFRDLELMNQALLAKQFWRLINCPHSLLHKCLAAKYFPGKDPLEASTGRRPSWGWRSLLAGRDLLIKGLRWRIGNGSRISVAKDLWLPRPYSFKPIRVKSGCPPLVSDLIDHHSMCWNQRLLKEFFLPEDTKIINSIPLRQSNLEDVLVWHFTTSGMYSVKSGYRLALELRERQQPGGASSASSVRGDSDCQMWGKIWKLNYPPKIKVFLWKACHDLVPTNEFRYHRKISTDSTCMICKADTESLIHIIFHCPQAHKFWMGSPLGLNTYRINMINFRDGWKSITDYLSRNHAMEFTWTWLVIGIWLLWKRRNKFIFQGIEDPISHIIALTDTRCNEWHARGSSPSLDADGISPHIITSFFYGNIPCVDAAREPDIGKTGLGWFMRTDDGLIILAGMKYVEFTMDVEWAEELAIFQGLVAVDKKFPRVTVFSDSFQAIQLISRDSLSSDHALLARDIRVEAARIGNPEFHHIPRSFNVIAHWLARKALLSCCSFLWNDCMPFEMGSLVLETFG